MKRSLFGYIMLAIGLGPCLWHETVFAQTAISNSAFSTAGGSAQRDSSALIGTAGQLAAAGRARSAQYSLFSGIIYNLLNNSPAVAAAIPDQNLTLGAGSFTRDLNASPAVFADSDFDALTYTARSSAANVATANIAGSMLTVAPAAVGEAVITVIANDGREGGENSLAFAVQVGVTSNSAPIVINAIADLPLIVGEDPFVRDLNAPPVFNDPDGHALSYTARSSAASIATAEISNSTLTVTAISAGEAMIIVSANDNNGGNVSDSFLVTVTWMNLPPVVANSIAPQTLNIGGPAFMRDLNEVFSDPNGNTLQYTASSSAPTVAGATISGALLTVTPVDTGIAEITVTASDEQSSVMTKFNVTVNPRINRGPVIIHSAGAAQPVNQSILVQANITDDTGVSRATLKYRQGGEAAFDSLNMSRAGDNFQGVIPAGSVTARGIEYFVTATDANGLTSRLPEVAGVFSIPIQISSEAKTEPRPGGTERTSYRLVSVPFQLNNPSAVAVLEDDLGTYNNTVWRLFGLVAGQPLSNKSPFAEVSTTGAFAAGQSLFLIVSEPNKRIDAGPGQTIPSHEEFRIALAPGHNFIATPFNFVVPTANLRLQSGSTTVTVRTYTGNNWLAAGELEPWEGYYVANNSTASDVLIVNPHLASGRSRSAADRSLSEGPVVQIIARCGEARDSENFAGFAASAEDGWDKNDLPEPPAIGEFVSVYFPHAEWQKPFVRYSDDMRSAAQPNQRWSFVVETNIIHEMVELKFERVLEIDPALAVFLVDEEMNYKQNLRVQEIYEYQARGVDKPKRLSLVIGNDEYVSEETAKVSGVPNDFVLEQNFPNPFNPETAIRFGLPERSLVTLRIYDLSGREIATVLENVELPAGRHQRVWSSRDHRGRAASSGIYFYRLTATSAGAPRKFQQTLKMVLAR